MSTLTLEKTEGVIPTVAKRQYILSLDASADSMVIDTAGASSVTILTNKAMTIKVPTIDTEGDYTTTETPYSYSGTAANADNDASTTNMHAEIAAGKAGWISGSVMPPAIVLANGASAVATVYIYIVWKK